MGKHELEKPLMTRLCASDVYKIYKRGSNARVDAMLLGFDHKTWQRENRSYIFKGQSVMIGRLDCQSFTIFHKHH